MTVSPTSKKQEVKNRWLYDLLLKKGKAPLEQINALVSQYDNDSQLAQQAVEKGLISDEDLARGFAEQLHIKYVELNDEFALQRDEVKLVPEPMARRYCMIALKRGEDASATIVMGDPLNIAAVDALRSLTKMDVHMAVGCRNQINQIIDKFYSEEAYLEESLGDIAETDKETVTVIDETRTVDDDQLKVLANDPPVVKFVNLVLMEAVRDGASDIHVEPGEDKVIVRIRIDGQLRVIPPPPKHLHRAIVTRIKILSNMDIAERRLPQDGRFKIKAHGRTIDVRVSSLPEIFGEKVVMRILDRTTLRTDMREIGFDEEIIRKYQKILKMPNGIILLTGPTGSGKTTTLYSALEFLRDPRRNIQTVEEPVEYQIDGINQMAVKTAIGLDFATALRFILRQDPDTILIGEIRDLDTAQIAMRAALTGHLVLSTLHTNDAPSAVWRLRDIGTPAYLIAATLRLVMSQRLVRNVCRNCPTAYTPPEEMTDLAARIDQTAGAWQFTHGAGCVKCSKTGYSGRTAIVEFLEVNNLFREKIVEAGSDIEIRQAAVKGGMLPLIHHGLQKVKAGITTIEEVLSVCPVDFIDTREAKS